LFSLFILAYLFSFGSQNSLTFVIPDLLRDPVEHSDLGLVLQNHLWIHACAGMTIKWE